MEQLSIPRIIISGTANGVGKSLLSLGIAYELRRRSMGVACAMLGTRLSESALFKRIVGRPVRCLDEQVLTTEQRLVSLHQASVGASILLLMGHGGLYDGFKVGSFDGSDAETAALSRTPVALVIDGRGFGQSVAALIKGFSDLAGSSRTEGGFDIAGAILNRLELPLVKGKNDAPFFNEAFKFFKLPALLGILPEFSHEAELPQHKISQQKNDTLLPRQFLIDLAKLVSQYVDLDRIVECAEQAPTIALDTYSNSPLGRRCRIAVSDDSCFGLCYQDNIDLLRYYGAEVVPFSPLADSELPKRIGAVYMTGGYLVDYGAELMRNTSMIESITNFAERGGVVYSEGAGTAYLSRDFRTAGSDTPINGVGLVPLSALHDNAGFAYQSAAIIEETIIGRPGSMVKGVTSGEWRATREERLMKTMRMSRGGASAVMEGYSPGPQMLSTFSFFHFGSNPIIAKNLADSAEVVEPLVNG